MEAVLRKLETQPVGFRQLQRAVPNARVMLYDDLPEKGSIDTLFGKKKCLIVFYQLHSKSGATREGTGHYSAVLKQKARLEWFSSYGMSPEQEIAMTHSKGKLIKLLGRNYIRSSARLQSRYHSNTCARWCAARCLLHDVKLGVFVKYFGARAKLDRPDDLVTLATMFLIR